MVLLVLGVVTAAAGAVMIGFGVPINEFSLGNTLIISGMTALVGGLVVIALSVATRQLMRIAALLTKGQPMPRRGGEGFDQTSEGSGPARMPFPPRPMPDHPRGPETRFAPPPPPPPAAAPNDPIFERLRNAPPAPPRPESRQPETPMLSDEEAPLSPLPPRHQRPAADQPAHEDTMLARVLRGSEARPAARPQPEKARNGSPPPAPSAPAAHPRPSFNDVWPETAREEHKADPFASRSDPFARQPEAAPARPNGESLRDAILREEQAHTPASILKSGVVDGMAYTLYTDGSIEAELAQGVVRFGSIEELRNHLEKSH
jgi:hypothetical protein